MNIEEFWEIIDSARVSAGGDADDAGPAIAAALVDQLAATSARTVLDFDDHFNKLSGDLCRRDVWAAGYLIGGGCSDDMFSDFRAGVIALGRDWYQRVLVSPDELADHPLVRRAAVDGDRYGLFAESVLYAADTAYQRITGDDHAFYDALEARGRGAVEPTEWDMGEEFDFDDHREMRRRLPRLAELFLDGEDT